MLPRHTETVTQAFQVLLRSPGRSALTVLGLAIGVAAFIAMVSFGIGARKSVMAQFEALGTHVLNLKTRVGTIGPTGRMARPLTDAEASALKRLGTTLDKVVPIYRRTRYVSAGSKNHRLLMYGTHPGFTALRQWPVDQGGMFTDEDVAGATRVCVVGASTAKFLFEDDEPLGKAISIDNLVCRVIGVLAPKGSSVGGSDLDDLLLMPATTYAAWIGDPEGYTFIDVSPKDPDNMAAARAEAIEILRMAHQLPPEEPDDFYVGSPEDVVKAAEQTAGILTRLLAGIAAVSLLVGGIGIMNILLVSVTERTHEIGIRSAIGASPRQILTQFLAEAITLSFVGSLAGATMGIIAVLLMAKPLGWSSAIDPWVVAGSTLFGVGVGVVFGFTPARRAARMDPIQALRRE
jgi:putative ABC transport system permease protein